MIEVVIHDLNSKGEGVAKTPDGKIVFVPGAWLNEKVSVEITDEKKSLLRGRLNKVIERSKNRVDPKCEFSGFSEDHCGGCPWMITSYESQVDFKKQKIQKLSQRYNLSDSPNFLESPKQYAYRGRANVFCQDDAVGFKAFHSNKVVDIDYCEVLDHDLNKQLAKLRTKKSSLNNAKISLNSSGSKYSQMFTQANASQNEQMKDELARLLSSEDLNHLDVAELFCGGGNFTKVILDSIGASSKLIVTDYNKESRRRILSLASNDKRLTEKFCNIMKAESLKSLSDNLSKTSMLVLNPPRAGFKELPNLCSKMPHLKTVIYVSCSEASFARDVDGLQTMGAEVLELAGFDTFPHTPHFEIMAKISFNR